MLARVKHYLWIAITPLCLTALFAMPSVSATEVGHPAETAEEHGGGGAHQFVANPLENIASIHYGKDNHGGTWEEGEHKMPAPFAGNLFNFFIFALLIGKYAGPSLRRVVRERHDEIAKALAESSRLREEAKARLDEYQTKVAKLDSEIQGLVAGIRAEAEAEKARLIAEAEARAERMKRDAEQQINAEMTRIRMTLEREAVEAAVSIAERVLKEKTSDADQRALADKFVKGLGDAAAKRRPRA